MMTDKAYIDRISVVHITDDIDDKDISLPICKSNNKDIIHIITENNLLVFLESYNGSIYDIIE